MKRLAAINLLCVFLAVVLSVPASPASADDLSPEIKILDHSSKLFLGDFRTEDGTVYVLLAEEPAARTHLEISLSAFASSVADGPLYLRTHYLHSAPTGDLTFSSNFHVTTLKTTIPGFGDIDMSLSTCCLRGGFLSSTGFITIPGFGYGYEYNSSATGKFAPEPAVSGTINGQAIVGSAARSYASEILFGRWESYGMSLDGI